MRTQNTKELKIELTNKHHKHKIGKMYPLFLYIQRTEEKIN